MDAQTRAVALQPRHGYALLNLATSRRRVVPQFFFCFLLSDVFSFFFFPLSLCVFVVPSCSASIIVFACTQVARRRSVVLSTGTGIDSHLPGALYQLVYTRAALCDWRNRDSDLQQLGSALAEQLDRGEIPQMQVRQPCVILSVRVHTVTVFVLRHGSSLQ